MNKLIALAIAASSLALSSCASMKKDCSSCESAKKSDCASCDAAKKSDCTSCEKK